MTGRLHVVGAGVAGLAAALAAAHTGRDVRLYEATMQAGGRCRSVEAVDGTAHDNGTHVLLGCNRQALAFLQAIEASDRWIEPEPHGLPVLDLADGSLHRIALSPWRWRDPALRPPGLGAADLLRLVRMLLPGPDRSVGKMVGRSAFVRLVIEPLTVAALNTPVSEASSRRLATVLRRIGLPGAGRLLVARQGLGPDLIVPALSTLADLGVTPALGHRLHGLAVSGGRAHRLLFADAATDLRPDDEVVLALPPYALARVLPDLALPERYEPIVNIHYTSAHQGPVRFVGVLGGLAQWVLFRPGTVSVTVSAAREAVQQPADALAARAWNEIRRAAAGIRLAAPPDLPPFRVVKEKRATITQSPGTCPLPPRRPLANVTLAGDWLSSLPATIEAAVASGVAAAGSPLRPPRPVRHASAHARSLS